MSQLAYIFSYSVPEGNGGLFFSMGGYGEEFERFFSGVFELMGFVGHYGNDIVGMYWHRFFSVKNYAFAF